MASKYATFLFRQLETNRIFMFVNNPEMQQTLQRNIITESQGKAFPASLLDFLARFGIVFQLLRRKALICTSLFYRGFYKFC